MMYSYIKPNNMKKVHLIALIAIILIEANAPANNQTVQKPPMNGSYFYSITKKAPPGDGWNYEDITCYVLKDSIAGAVPFYRFYSDGHEYFYSTNKQEGDKWYKFQKIECYVFSAPVNGTEAFWRSHGGGYQHFYSADKHQIAINPPFNTLELPNPACYVYATQINGSTPLYRFRYLIPNQPVQRSGPFPGP